MELQYGRRKQNVIKDNDAIANNPFVNQFTISKKRCSLSDLDNPSIGAGVQVETISGIKGGRFDLQLQENVDRYLNIQIEVQDIFGNENTGTIFYNKKNGEGKTEIDWKLNRGVFFSRKERETWHSYQGDGINDRIALVYNLMTKKNNIKEVCEIEKKNYILSLLRFKINPYLYQILGKTI